MSSEATVVVRNVSKTFSLTQSGSERGLSPKKRRRQVHALTDVSFAAFSGEAVGVLGRNGSGKSTLLNIIAGNEQPSEGTVLVSGQPTLLSVSAALQGHLTGEQNIRLGLLAKGLSPHEVEQIQPSVAEWSDIGEAISRPLKTYSSGMKARLKFAIATAVRPQILLVDEALATGDAAFSAKAKSRMDSFLNDTGTVFIVSHSAATIRKHCRRVIWIHEGVMLADGHVEDISPIYEEWTKAAATGDTDVEQEIVDKTRQEFNRPRILLDSEAAWLLDENQ